MINLLNYGTVTSEFGNRTAPTKGASTYHQGIDLVLFNDNIPAVVGGTVVENNYQYYKGNYITIKDDKGNLHTYMHMNERSKLKTGTVVKEGQTIGVQGNTGASTGKHLHYQVKADGEYVNPRNYFGKSTSNTYNGAGANGSSIKEEIEFNGFGSSISDLAAAVLKIVLCILLFIGAAFFLMKAFDVSLPSKEKLIKKGVENLG